MAEPDAARSYGVGAGVNVNLETEQAQAAVSAMTASLRELQRSLSDFGNSASTMAEKINRHLKSIGDTATKVASQLSSVSAAAAGAGAGGATPAAQAPSTAAPSSTPGASGAGWVQNAASSATAAINRVLNKQSTGALTGGLSLGTFVGTQGESLTKDLVLAPLRFLRSRINTNRDTAIMASGALNMVGMQQGSVGSVGQGGFNGIGTAGMMSAMAGFPGGIMGNPQDLIEMMAAAPALGASYGFGGRPNQANTRGQGVRASGFFRGLQEMQQMNPLASAGELTGTLGGYAGNTGAQQRAMMFTGGAMGMISAGGRQKSLSEWAESILRWFEGLRPGGKRGKGFTYGELMAQYFPGSNIDAWFNVNGVPQNMRDYWWTYALAKTTKVADTTATGFTIGAEESNVAWNRLRASSELTRTEFSLAGQMAGQYSNREQSNRWFNELLGSIQQDLIPKIAKGPFKWLQSLPDSIEDLLMTGAERGMTELLGDAPEPGSPGTQRNRRRRNAFQQRDAVFGNSGDIGDSYGDLGGTGLGGLHPDMRSKISKMMRDNPRIRITSGLRDTGLQKRLKDKGHSRVSGKPSEHTRGQAADLGPPSQYGWIAANANKYGLSSGRKFGEPWHVGMRGAPGDVGDAMDEFLSAIKEFGTDDPATGMASFITKILTKIVGGVGKLFGGGEDEITIPEEGAEDRRRRQGGVEKGFTDRTGAAGFRSDYYKSLLGASKKVVIGIPTYSDASKGTKRSGGTYGSIDPNLGFDEAFQSANNLDRAAATAKVAKAAGGWTGEDLVKMVAIAGRESSWTPSAHRSDTPGKPDNKGDRGLFQINEIWNDDLTNAGIISGTDEAGSRDLYNPNKNAAAAKYVFDQQGWTAWTTYNAGLSNDQIAFARQAVQAAGLGDVDDQAQYAMRLNQTGLAAFKPDQRAMTFNNNITITAPMSGGVGGGGMDARRTAEVLADHLEREMKSRLARAS